jgi:hypothetical protein
MLATAIELFRKYFVSDPFAFAYTNAWIYVRVHQVPHALACRVLSVLLCRARAITIDVNYALAQAVATGAGVAEGIASKGITAPPPPSPFIFFGVIEPFCEAVLCNMGVKSLGGHAIFDTTIVVGTVLSALRQPAGLAKKFQ